LVPPARRRRAELLLDLAGIDAVWGTGPSADEIKKLDQERMLGDAIFAEETTSDDLVLARALLAERSPEDIAAALARLYRARLPSPEDLLDPGERGGKSRDDRGPGKHDRASRGDDRDGGAGSKPKKLRRDAMPEGSVWFRAAIGRRKNAEARWLLPMICRRGGVEKQDIGAIRIMDTTTEFEISARVADAFASKIKRPDKEDNIRIEPLGDAPGARPHAAKSWDGPKHKPKETGHHPRREDRPRDEHKPHSKPHGEGKPRFEQDLGAKRKKQHRDWPDNDGRPRGPGGSHERPPFKKKKKKNKR
jgi:ATP-dependent RNA helicase DeaD